MRYSTVLLLLVSCLFWEDALSGKVLVVLPLPMYSHSMPYVPLFKGLADKGHQLTFVSPFASKLAVPNFNNVNIPFNLQKMKDIFGKIDPNDLTGFWYEFFGSWKFCPKLSEFCLSEVKDFLPPKSEKFDVIIIEAFFCQQPLVALGHYYGAPVVAIHPGPMTPTVSYHTGNPTLSSYVPNIRTPLTDRMDFWARVKNSAMTAVELIGNKFIALKAFDKLMREWIDIPDLPPIEDMLSNLSLVLIDTHYSLNYARPYAKNILEVGGMSVKVADPLPQDLEKFISEAEHGVIYFSLGSYIDGEMNVKFLLDVMESFRHVKQRVLFKIDKIDFPNIPENVLVKAWFPQQSILSHKKVVLFISHGGLNSINEAVYNGVPVLGIPFYVDQPHNIRLLEELGVGLHLSKESIKDSSVIVTAMRKILDNPSYRARAQERSRIFMDRPMPVVDEAVYWLEYVMKFGGARHLRPAATDLSWYQLYLLDVAGFEIGVLLAAVVVVVWIVNRLRRKSTSPSAKSSKKEK